MNELAELRAREAKARQAIAEATIQIVVSENAQRLGVFDPQAAALLIDRALLVHDEDGRPINVLEALDALLERAPYLTDGERAEELRRKAELRKNPPPFRGFYRRAHERMEARYG